MPHNYHKCLIVLCGSAARCVFANETISRTARAELVISHAGIACTELKELRYEDMVAASGSNDARARITQRLAMEAVHALVVSCEKLSVAFPQFRLHNNEIVPDNTSGSKSSNCSQENQSCHTALDYETVPWLFDIEGLGFPWLHMCSIMLALLLFMIFFEACFLQTSLFTRLSTLRIAQLSDAAYRYTAVTAMGIRTPRERGDDTSDDDEHSVDDCDDSDRTDQPESPGDEAWGKEQTINFWRKVRDYAITTDTPQAGRGFFDVAAQPDVVQFTHRAFYAYASSGKATITVEREGSCANEVVVLVRTVERVAAGYKAVAGIDFDHIETTLTFTSGMCTTSFDVVLHKDEAGWSPTQWFSVELVQVVSGGAVFGAPLLLRWDGNQSNENLFARVYIVAENIFPHDIPYKYVNSSAYLVIYYLRERIKKQGKKFWKTMAGMLYDPFHNVLVMTVIQKTMVFWACDWETHQSGCYWRILFLVGLQVVSTAILSWGDRVQTSNRGRTGGTRQHHRWQLLAKMLMVGHDELRKAAPSQWFYAAMQNVESMTMDAYWQTYLMAQNIFALMVTILTTYIFFRGTHSLDSHPFATTFFMFSTVPFTLLWIRKRKHMIWDMCNQRADAEEKWVHTFTWVVHAASGLYSYGPRERAWLEQRFTTESKVFVSKHVVARDMLNDSVWANRWVASLAYCVLLFIGANNLIHSYHDEGFQFEAVNLVLLLKLSWDFQKYVAKLIENFACMQRAGISIQRVKNLLDTHARHSAPISQEPSSPGPMADNIELRAVEYLVPDELDGVSPMGSLRMLPQSMVVIPLRKMVRVTGAPEPVQTTFMALVAQVLRPSSGVVASPPSAWAVMLPSVSVGCPFVTVQEALQIATMPTELAKRFALVLGLNTTDGINILTRGQNQAITLVRVLMRDPAVLVLVRPFALMEQALRQRLQWMLRVWQQGGAQRIVEWLLERPASVGTQRLTRRTVVVTSEDMDGDDRSWTSDVRLDLSTVLEKDIPFSISRECIDEELPGDNDE